MRGCRGSPMSLLPAVCPRHNAAKSSRQSHETYSSSSRANTRYASTCREAGIPPPSNALPANQSSAAPPRSIHTSPLTSFGYRISKNHPSILIPLAKFSVRVSPMRRYTPVPFAMIHGLKRPQKPQKNRLSHGNRLIRRSC